MSLGVGLWVGLGAFLPSARAEQPRLLVLADFNDARRNEVQLAPTGGAFQVWAVNPSCRTLQFFVPQDALGLATGSALRLVYAVDRPPHFTGWYLFLTPDERQGIDMTGFDRLGLFVKGTSRFSIELKDEHSRDDGTPRGVAQYLVTQVGEDWRQVEVPFSAFQSKTDQPLDLTGIRQLVIVFSDVYSMASGEVMLDHLYFSDGPMTFPLDG